LFLGDVPRGDKACRKVDEGSVHLLLAHNSLPDSGRYIHSAPYQFIQCGCFVHAFDDVPFQEINMPVIQLKKMLLHHRGIPSRILAISPAIRESTKVQNAVSTTSAESLVFSAPVRRSAHV